MRLHTIFGSLFLTVAIALLSINVVGIAAGERYFWQADPQQDWQRTYVRIQELESLERRADESHEAYALRITRAVALHMLHYWVPDDERGSWDAVSRMYLPLTENYVVYWAGLKDHLKGKSRGIEFYDAEVALRRGYGYCSQQAMILVDLLNDNGVPTTTVGLGGHVVAEAEIRPNIRWLLDPDYNVIVPHSLQDVEDRPGLIRTYYAGAGYPAATVDLLEKIYAAESNVQVSLSSQLKSKARNNRDLQRTYILKWAIPVTLLLVGVWLLRRRGSNATFA